MELTRRAEMLRQDLSLLKLCDIVIELSRAIDNIELRIWEIEKKPISKLEERLSFEPKKKKNV